MTLPVDPPRDDRSLRAAKDRLDGIADRPIDIDSIIAHEREKMERAREVEKSAQRTLDVERAKAQKRREEALVKNVEQKHLAELRKRDTLAKKSAAENKALQEKAARVERERMRLENQLKSEQQKTKQKPK